MMGHGMMQQGEERTAARRRTAKTTTEGAPKRTWTKPLFKGPTAANCRACRQSALCRGCSKRVCETHGLRCVICRARRCCLGAADGRQCLFSKLGVCPKCVVLAPAGVPMPDELELANYRRFPEASDGFEVQDPAWLLRAAGDLHKCGRMEFKRRDANPHADRMVANTFVAHWDSRYSRVTRVGFVSCDSPLVWRWTWVVWVKFVLGPWYPHPTSGGAVEDVEELEDAYRLPRDERTNELLWLRARWNPLRPWRFETHRAARPDVRSAVETLVALRTLEPECPMAALPNELLECIAAFLL